MPLEERFVSASIKEVAPSVWKAILTYSYYGLYEFKKVYVYKSLQECKDRVLIQRCPGIIIVDVSNKDVVLKLTDG